MEQKPALSKEFMENLECITEHLHGRPITIDFASEWKISEANAKLLLEYLYQRGRVEIAWLPEMKELCYVKKSYTVN
ncbi:hypothetical protein ABIE26_000812 [Pedobacter africanus]|uniref:Uncharacterized protein n=1 Tax=Pedobacter africanus TaxID=151894 RepID=A0ACC6KUC0_9SPHI|nr:hypothetical protein [Pedobacter africanus]MDR6782701.1 hypothetical protein [Pedobacter africanus]